jgi:tripartite-type tricarboxylate transporter receptor subunit TctC
VARIGHGTVALIVPAASKAQSVKDLVALAKANPGRMTFASSGTGALIHLTGELFKQQAGIDMTHVPYKARRRSFPTCSTAVSTWRSTACRHTWCT